MDRYKQIPRYKLIRFLFLPTNGQILCTKYIFEFFYQFPFSNTSVATIISYSPRARSARRPREKGENAQRKFPRSSSIHAWNMKFPAGPIFTRVYTREARKVGNRSRGPVVNRDRRRASRATLTGGCKQAESHAREFDGSWFSRLSAHGERRRRGEEGRYGCHVAETRQACRSPSRNFISGRNAPLSLFFFLFSSFSFVRRNENGRTRFLMAFRCCLINSNEFLLFRGNTCFDSTLNFRLYYFSESRDTWPSEYIFIFIPGE